MSFPEEFTLKFTLESTPMSQMTVSPSYPADMATPGIQGWDSRTWTVEVWTRSGTCRGCPVQASHDRTVWSLMAPRICGEVHRGGQRKIL